VVVSDGVTTEEIAALRQEAAEARRLAATLSDSQAITDLTLYAEALEAELAKLIGNVMEPELDLRAPATETSFLARPTESAGRSLTGTARG